MHVLLVFQRINVEKRYVYPQTEPSVRNKLDVCTVHRSCCLTVRVMRT